MPLIHSKSKKAFSENVGKEMESGKPQKQALAIAYDVKRRAPKRKKMAEGGKVNESAASERRPMPDERDNDSRMVSQNSSRKDNAESGWTDQPTVKQAQKPSITPRRPRMAEGRYKVRDREDVVKEEMMMSELAPDGYGKQPDKEYDEQGANRQGSKVSDMEDEHSTHRKPYAKGGQVEASDYSARPNKYEDDLLDLPPSEDEGASMAHSDDEEGQDRQGPQVSDMEHEHSNGRKPYAGGGNVEPKDEDNISYVNKPDKGYGAIIFKAEGGEVDSNEQPEPEANMEHHDSITAAIMARRDRMKKMIDSGSMDEDDAVMMASGGMIHSHDSIYPSESSQVDLSRNADEDANEEDQLSFNALRKENYSESEGLNQLDQPEDSNEHGHELEDEDSHDMVSQIRSKMNKQRQFKVR